MEVAYGIAAIKGLNRGKGGGEKGTLIVRYDAGLSTTAGWLDEAD